MASKTCGSCLRTLQRQSRFIAQVCPIFSLDEQLLTFFQSKQPISRLTASRAFTTTRRRHAESLPPNATPSNSIPPVTPKPVEGGTTAKGTAAEAAAVLSKKGGITGTYTAYGATEELYKECAKQADYKITKAEDSDAETPKTEDGEDLGVGEGWWHTGICPSPWILGIQLTENRSGIKPHLQHLVPSNNATHVPPRRPIPLLRTKHLTNLATTHPRPLLLRRRKQNGVKPRHACARYAKQISERHVRAMARLISSLR